MTNRSGVMSTYFGEEGKPRWPKSDLNYAMADPIDPPWQNDQIKLRQPNLPAAERDRIMDKWWLQGFDGNYREQSGPIEYYKFRTGGPNAQHYVDLSYEHGPIYHRVEQQVPTFNVPSKFRFYDAKPKFWTTRRMFILICGLLLVAMAAVIAVITIKVLKSQCKNGIRSPTDQVCVNLGITTTMAAVGPT